MAYAYNSQLVVCGALNSPIDAALPALGHALAGSTGAAVSNLAIYPLDLITTRLQVQRALEDSSISPSFGTTYTGLVNALETIYHEEGITGLYSGVLLDTGKSVADSFLFFLFYDYFKSSRMNKYGMNKATLPVLDELVISGLSGVCSKLFTIPIANIVTRKQSNSMTWTSSNAEPTLIDITRRIRKEKGWQGFWSGYSATLVLTLNPSITFFLHEFFRKSLLLRSTRDNPGASTTFLIAAISKAIASTITYPFSLAKVRAQMSSKPPVEPSFVKGFKPEIMPGNDGFAIKKSGGDPKILMKRNNVFMFILNIYRTEGPAALYEGVCGEILKGFFSHGITMIFKDNIHRMIIQVYFLVLKTFKKYGSPSELASRAGTAMQDQREAVGAKLKETSGETKNRYANILQAAGNKIDAGTQVVGASIERVGVIGNNATEAAKVVSDFASREAGNLLGNANILLGGRILDRGGALKPEKI